AADVDGDGLISMDDFRYMLDVHRVTNLVQVGAAATSTGTTSAVASAAVATEEKVDGEPATGL
ncbi:unnamed protein product, partial [Symbiodinium microadriaticum]